MALLPALYALLAPVLFIPNAIVDAYILPRTALAVTAGFGLAGVAVGLFRLDWRAALRSPRGLLPAGAAVGAAILIAWATSANRLLSLAGAYTRYESVTVRIAYLGLFAGAALLLSRPGGQVARRRALQAFVIGCSAAAGEAGWQLHTHALARPDGNLGQPNLLGVLLAMAIPLALQAGLRFWPWLVSLPVLGVGLYASSSRSGWLAACAGCAIVLVAVFPRRARRAGALLGALGVAGALAVLLLSPLRTLNNDTGSARLGVWGDGLRLAAARPVTGWGEDATGLVFGRFQTRDWEPGDTFDRIHDQPIDLLVTQGIVGLLACGWFWTLVVARCAGALRAGGGGAAALRVGAPLGALGAYAAWALLNFDWAPATGPFWLLGGLAWAEASEPVRAPSAAPPGRPAAAAGAALAALAVLAGLPVLVADRAYYAGHARQAVALDPLQATYHRALGESLGRSGAGLRELERAAELGEYDYQFLIELGDAERDAGHMARARGAYLRARESYRYDPTADLRLSELGAG